MTEKAGEVTLFGFSYNCKGTVIMNKFERFVTVATANLRQKDANGLQRIDSNGDSEIYQYTTYGTCSKDILIELKGGIVSNVQFDDGCPGGLAAIGKLLTGLHIDKVITNLKGISYRNGTSCGDQLAQALEQIQELRKNNTVKELSSILTVLA
jgi:uncharacterized protein (TIGR03905 family)